MRFKVFHFLNDLRDLTTINMRDAAPFIQDEFGVDGAQAKKWLIEWMAWAKFDK